MSACAWGNADLVFCIGNHLRYITMCVALCVISLQMLCVSLSETLCVALCVSSLEMLCESTRNSVCGAVFKPIGNAVCGTVCQFITT